MTPTPAVLAVALYAGLNGLILVWLAVNTGRTRMRRKIIMGDGGDPELIRAMRGQANFVEYTPLVLVQLAAMALLGAPGWVVHLFGLTLTLGRALHAWHFTHATAPEWQRGVGTGLTVLTLLGLSAGLIAHAVWGMS